MPQLQQVWSLFQLFLTSFVSYGVETETELSFDTSVGPFSLCIVGQLLPYNKTNKMCDWHRVA